MVQCQTNPDGRCAMEPHCPPGECYLYAVAMKEHSDAIGAITEDFGVARELAAGLPYPGGPFTESEPWDRSKLGLVNAVIDTLVPGARLAVDDNSGQPRVYLGRTRVWERPRNLAASLRELADWLDGSR